MAAKIALDTAGPMGGTTDSPIPVGASVERTIWTSTLGISSIRRHRIVVKIRLFDFPVLQSDCAIENGAQAKGYSPFHLCAEHIRINRHTAIHGTHYAIYFDPVIRANRYLRHLRYRSAKGIMHRKAPSFAVGDWRSPAGFFRDQFKNSAVTRKLGEQARLHEIGSNDLHRFVSWVLHQKSTAELIGISTCCMSNVIQERFDCKGVVTVADGTPFFYRYAEDR